MFVVTDHLKKVTLEDDEEIENSDVWEVVSKFISHNGFLQHQIESFNEFVEMIPKIIEENSTVSYEGYKIKFGNVHFERPAHKELTDNIREITPKECIDREITYLSNIVADVTVTRPLAKPKVNPKEYIGSIPVMKGSVLCNLSGKENDRDSLIDLQEDIFDQGGYFIIKGACKIIASQQRTAYNYPFVFKDKKTRPKFPFFCEVRSISPHGAHSTTTQVGILKKLISVVVPYIDITSIPLTIIFYALGAKNEKDILDCIVPLRNDQQVMEILVPSFEQSYSISTQEAALHYIGKRGKKFMNGEDIPSGSEEKARTDAISYARHLLSSEFLPHLGSGEESFIKKRFFLGVMTKKLIDVCLGRRPLEDRDHYTNKRIATAGILLSQLFYTAWKKFRSEINSRLERFVRSNNIVSVQSLMKTGTIKTMMCNALSNNTWSGRKMNGVSQNFDRFNYSASLANARKFVTSISSDSGKIEAPRHLHNSHWGVVCPSETPEGKKCGLVTNASVQCVISTGSDPGDIICLLENMKIISFDEVTKNTKEYLNLTKMFVNGDLIGVTKFPENIVNELRLLRRQGCINPETSIVYTPKLKEIQICTDAGRMMRPLFIVEGNSLVIKKSHIKELARGDWDFKPGGAWSHLLSQGFVELIDKSEESSITIALYPSDLAEKKRKFTHCEIHPCLILGIGASLIPYPDHNQSPRNTYQAAMGKQAIGVPGSNYLTQTKGKFHVMNYPQKPLVSTKLSRIIGFDDLPAGQNAVVAICPWYGFGQEDSIIMNQDSIDRGFMLITTYTAYDAKIQRDKNEKFEIPKIEECSNYKGNPEKLDVITGIITEGETVNEGDILIGKTIEVTDPNTIHQKKKTNVSVIYDHPWPGKVHLIQFGINGEGYEYVRVVISQQRPPENGDKFAARHGQKGTIGIKYRSYDLPYTSEGIAPDIIVNPLALPSRMTIGMLIEMIQGRKIASSFLQSVPVKKVFRLDHEDWDNPEDKLQPSKKKKYTSTADATPFENFSIQNVIRELEELGIKNFCEEEMINGQTGEVIPTMIFTGVCYYQRLKHMVIDKVHARSRGGRTRMTRQPREGRKVGGGFRTGSMERDCLLGQGSPYFAKDRLMEQSDETRVWFCRICGLQATVSPPRNNFPGKRECKVCTSNKIALIKLPYATKLLMQEFAGMNVVIRVLSTSFEPGSNVSLTNGRSIFGHGTVVKVQ